MGFIEFFLLAVGLSMDAFAVSICAGLTMAKTNMRKALVIGLYFGGFQAGMPMIGYYIAGIFADKIVAFDHWIAFGLLCILGAKMIYEGCKKQGCADRECPEVPCNDRTCPDSLKASGNEYSVKPAVMLPLAFATSIDALAVGVSLAFLRVSIFPAASFIGVTTLVISIAGVKVGCLCGERLRLKTQLAGGVILVLIGLKILLEHVLS